MTFADFLNAPGFALGDVLTGVTLSATINETLLTLTLHNTNASSSTVRFTSAGSYDIGGTAPDQDALENAIFALGPTPLFASGLQTITAGATYTAPTGAAPTGIGSPVPTTTGAIAAASITPYNSSGTFTLDFDSLTAPTVSGGGGNVIPTETIQNGASFVVTYTYTTAPATPEPGTMSLLVSALFGIGMVARKRIRQV